MNPSALRILETVALEASANAGHCELTNEQLAVAAGTSARATREWVRKLVADGHLFSSGSGKARRLSLSRNPATDAQLQAARFVMDIDDLTAGGQGEYHKTQETIAKTLGISDHVTRRAIAFALESGWVERTETIIREGQHRKKQHTYRMTEKGFKEVVVPRDEKAKARGTLRQSAEVERLKAELAARDARIAELESRLAAQPAVACTDCVANLEARIAAESDLEAALSSTVGNADHAEKVRLYVEENQEQWEQIKALRLDLADANNRAASLSRSSQTASNLARNLGHLLVRQGMSPNQIKSNILSLVPFDDREKALNTLAPCLMETENDYENTSPDKAA